MEWGAIAAIVFIATAVNHLGLIAAIERIIRRKLWIIDCPKCLTCWSVMGYLLLTGSHPLPSLAIALIAAYAAIWIELFMYFIDTIYNRIYGKIEDYNKENGEQSS